MGRDLTCKLKLAAVVAAVAALVAVNGIDTGGSMRRTAKPRQPLNQQAGYELAATSSSPQAGSPFRAVVRGRDGGQVSLDVVAGGERVGHVGSGTIRNGRFEKRWAWPAASAGYAVKLFASVQTGTKTLELEYPVTVRP